MEKIKALSNELNIDIDDISVERFKNAWFEVDMFVDTMDDVHYLVLDAEEIYYGADMYGIANMDEIITEEYNIYVI